LEQFFENLLKLRVALFREMEVNRFVFRTNVIAPISSRLLRNLFLCQINLASAETFEGPVWTSGSRQ